MTAIVDSTDNAICPASGNKPINSDLLSACIHCGLCLPACPTYLATGREMESPRGRIHLLSQWNNGELPLTPRLIEHIDSCLGCLGCQTACPSGVQYGKILNQARPRLAAQNYSFKRLLLRVVFKSILPNYSLLRWMTSALIFWQKIKRSSTDSHKDKNSAQAKYDISREAHDASLTTKPPWHKRLTNRLKQWSAFLPELKGFQELPKKSWAPGAKKATMQLFSGCVMDVFYNHVNHAAIRLLTAQSFVVEHPEQTCCGALAMHAGEIDIAKNLARRNIELFEQTEGTVAVTSAGCGAMLKEYAELLHDEPAWHERALAFSARVADITSVLADNSFKRLPDTIENDLPLKVAYHAACHLAHAQNIREAPAFLLERLADDVTKIRQSTIQIIPLAEAEHCCGSAGIYNLLHPEMALAILKRKLENIAKTDADLIVTSNPGCLLQLEAGLKNAAMPVSVCHIVELLDKFYCQI